MSRTTLKQSMERPKRNMYHNTRNARSLSPAQEKQFDRIMQRALSRLDEDDYSGFWDGIEKLNAFSLLARGD